MMVLMSFPLYMSVGGSITSAGQTFQYTVYTILIYHYSISLGKLNDNWFMILLWLLIG